MDVFNQLWGLVPGDSLGDKLQVISMASGIALFVGSAAYAWHQRRKRTDVDSRFKALLTEVNEIQETTTLRHHVYTYIASGRIEVVVSARLPDLQERLAEMIAKKIVMDIVQDAVLTWQKREKEVIRLDDITPYAASLMQEWIVGNEIKQAIEARVRRWIEVIINELNADLYIICDRYTGMPRETLNLNAELGPMEGNGVSDPIEPGRLWGGKEITKVVTVVDTAISGIMAEMAGFLMMSLVVVPLVGPIVLSVVLGVAALDGISAEQIRKAEERIRKANVWPWLRAVVRFRVQAKAREWLPSTKAKIAEHLSKQDFSNVIQQAQGQISTQLLRRADEGMARHYSNLAALHQKKGDLAAASAYWRKARDLWREVGDSDKADQCEDLLSKNSCSIG